MKKIITICLLVVTLLAGGMTMEAKTTKKKAKAKTTRTTKSKIPAGAFAMIKIWGDQKLYLTKNGKVEDTNGWWSGEVIENNDAYILVIEHDIDGNAGMLGVIYNNTFYIVINNSFDPLDFWEYYWDHPYDFNNCVSFDPDSQTVTYRTIYGSKTESLSSVPARDRYKVTWLNK